MGPNVPDERTELEARWRRRESEWARKLGRLHLGVEPLEVQLARYRGVTWGLTIVPAIIGLMFLGLFSAFGRPDIGLFLDAILLLPITLSAWLDFKRMERRARSYLEERERFEAERAKYESLPSETRSAPEQT